MRNRLHQPTMNATPESYQPFFNRRLAPELRQLIIEGHRLLDAAAAGRELRRFAVPATHRPAAAIRVLTVNRGVPRWTAWPPSRAA